jgi:tetratricopeptide (TPR) repeat protein
VTGAAGPENLVQRRLRELEALGLSRPASALFTEYLAVLVAEGLIDAAATERIGLAYHRLHYGSVAADDPELIEAAARLDEIKAKVASLPDEEREQLARRIRARLGPCVAGQQHPAASPQFLAGSEPASELRASATPPEPGSPFADGGRMLSPGTPSVLADKKRRRLVPRWPQSISLEVVLAAIVILFLAGYFSHTLVMRAASSRGRDGRTGNLAESDAFGTSASSTRVRGNRHFWIGRLREHALSEAAHNHDQAARLSYELVVLYAPKDALALNNLAWLYLTCQDPKVRDPKRGLELAKQAVKLNRSSVILDTAAEAYFQTGNADLAVKLEREAITRAQRMAGDSGGNFQRLLQDQLAKFQGGKPSVSSEAKPASSAPVPAKRPG